MSPLRRAGRIGGIPSSEASRLARQAAATLAPTMLLLAGGGREPRLPLLVSALLTTAIALRMLWRAVQRADRLNAELERQNAMPTELDAAKDRFVACVSHELRTPLTSIRGYIELVREEAESLTAEQQGFLATVERNSERLLHLVDDLLYIARINSETIDIERVPVNLEALAAEAIETARPTATHAGIALSLSVDRSAPGRLLGDREQLLRLLDNLLSNAIKFTPRGGAVTVETNAGDSEAWLVVNDTGIGMSTTDAERVFDRFFRSNRADELAIQGAGIGLTIVQAIANAHGGDVRVLPRPEGGTSFAVRLPTDGFQTPIRSHSSHRDTRRASPVVAAT